MKRAYQVCRVLGWLGFLMACLFLEDGRWALALTPSALLFAAAAILNHLLPPEERAKVELGARNIRHPYLDLVMVLAAMGIGLFATENRWVGWVLLSTMVVAHLIAIGYYVWQRKQDKKKTRHYYHRTGRSRKGH